MENKKLFKSKLDKFIAKRAALFLIIMTAADIAFLGSNRWLVLAGLFIGVFVSIGRIFSNEWMLMKIFQLNKGKAVAGSIVVFTISQLVLIPVIVLTYFLSVWILYGLIAGILIIPIAIMINSITEALGITKNSFE